MYNVVDSTQCMLRSWHELQSEHGIKSLDTDTTHDHEGLVGMFGQVICCSGVWSQSCSLKPNSSNNSVDALYRNAANFLKSQQRKVE